MPLPLDMLLLMSAIPSSSPIHLQAHLFHEEFAMPSHSPLHPFPRQSPTPEELAMPSQWPLIGYQVLASLTTLHLVSFEHIKLWGEHGSNEGSGLGTKEVCDFRQVIFPI